MTQYHYEVLGVVHCEDWIEETQNKVLLQAFVTMRKVLSVRLSFLTE